MTLCIRISHVNFTAFCVLILFPQYFASSQGSSPVKETFFIPPWRLQYGGLLKLLVTLPVIR